MMVPRSLLIFSLLLAPALYAVAHHSLPALFDTSLDVSVTGTVTRFEFKAPHSYVHLDIVEEGGTITWELETYPPGMLIRQGLTPDTLPVGTRVSAAGYPARDGRPLMRLLTLTFPDGSVRVVQGH